MDAQFQMAMKALFDVMGIELSPERQNETYSVSVDEQIRMNFFAVPKGYLNVICDLGKLPEAVDPAVLVNLLKLNCFTPFFRTFISRSDSMKTRARWNCGCGKGWMA